jgi:hypothetical protein
MFKKFYDGSDDDDEETKFYVSGYTMLDSD